VDTTVRAAASRDWVWQNLIHPRTQIKVIPAASVIAQVEWDSPEMGRTRPTRH
jgi:hypothetical protein